LISWFKTDRNRHSAQYYHYHHKNLLKLTSDIFHFWKTSFFIYFFSTLLTFLRLFFTKFFHFENFFQIFQSKFFITVYPSNFNIYSNWTPKKHSIQTFISEIWLLFPIQIKIAQVICINF
jgi:hypothetical protein